MFVAFREVPKDFLGVLAAVDRRNVLAMSVPSYFVAAYAVLAVPLLLLVLVHAPRALADPQRAVDTLLRPGETGHEEGENQQHDAYGDDNSDGHALVIPSLTAPANRCGPKSRRLRDFR